MKNHSHSLLSLSQGKANSTGSRLQWDYFDAQPRFNDSWRANVIVYIDDLLIHSDTHEQHLQILEQVLERLQQNHLKINLEKCIFGNKEVSYLGFTLTPEGIKPGKNKVKAIQTAKAPADVKTIRSFIGLCNFFRTHIKDFAVIATPLFTLTRKDSGYNGGPLPEAAIDAFRH